MGWGQWEVHNGCFKPRSSIFIYYNIWHMVKLTAMFFSKFVVEFFSCLLLDLEVSIGKNVMIHIHHNITKKWIYCDVLKHAPTSPIVLRDHTDWRKFSVVYFGSNARWDQNLVIFLPDLTTARPSSQTEFHFSNSLFVFPVSTWKLKCFHTSPLNWADVVILSAIFANFTFALRLPLQEMLLWHTVD